MLGGLWALWLRTGWVVVRRKVRSSAVVEVDGDRVFGDVDGELSVGVGSAEGQFLPDDGDDPAVGGSALHRDGCYRGPWWGAGGSGPAQSARLVGGQRVGAGAQQLAGVGIEEHQRRVFDADAHAAPGEDLRRE